MPVFQRRFASDEVSPVQEKTTDETVPTEPTATEQSMKEEAITSEAQAEQEPNVVEESVSEAADVTNAAVGILGNSARNAASGTHNDPKPSRILYVGNLFFEVKGQDLEREFSSYGEVVNARVAEDARGLSRGYVMDLQD
jgi:nucleolin